MKRLLMAGILFVLLGLGLAGAQSVSPNVETCTGCCTSQADCPTPNCCSK